MVNDRQVKRLWRLAEQKMPLEIASAKAGMDPKTARKYLRDRRLPSEMQSKHTWRTRPDPFADNWEEVRQMLAIERHYRVSGQKIQAGQGQRRIVDNEEGRGNGGLWKAKTASHRPWKTLRVSHIPTATTTVTLSQEKGNNSCPRQGEMLDSDQLQLL